MLQMASVVELRKIAEVAGEHNHSSLASVDMRLSTLQYSRHLSDTMLYLNATTRKQMQLTVWRAAVNACSWLSAACLSQSSPAKKPYWISIPPPCTTAEKLRAASQRCPIGLASTAGRQSSNNVKILTLSEGHQNAPAPVGRGSCQK